jgi:SAM-dependent methyltransferase
MLDRADPGTAGRPLTDLLRCPTCAAQLAVEADEATCVAGRHTFPLVEGVIVLVGEDELGHDPQYALQRGYFDSEFAAYRTYEPDRWRRSYLRRIRAAGALRGPLVDVGVGGSGHTVIEAAREGALAVGCDLSLAGLVRARRHALAEGVGDRTLWVCCTAERLPLATGAFSSALAVAVIEHVPDDRAALCELARVLQPGGRAWVTVPHALRNITPVFRPPNRRHDRRLGHLRRYEADELSRAGRAAGLETAAVAYTGHPVKVLQLAGSKVLRGRLADRFWSWCERRDLVRSGERRGSMQLTVVFTRS